MSSLLFAAAAAAAFAAGGDAWRCRNQIEVWCTADGCAAAPPGEFTPLDIHVATPSGLSVCAYSGCWEGRVRARKIAGRYLWAGDNLPFSTASEGAMTADVTVLLFAGEGVGFVRAGGIATPLLCEKAGPGEE
jgi:hypothetical protein